MVDLVHGTADPAFGKVRELFEASVADGRNLGASVAVYVGGRAVVELWGGTADAKSGRPWERDTLCVTFSSTKAVTATAALRVAAERGILIDSPVADWWPEYACAGKESTTLEDFLTHRAGLPVLERPVSAAEAAEPGLIAGLLAAQSPLWEPGSRHGYHALTYGWLLGEFIRRHTDSTVGDYVRREIGSDLHIGVPEPLLEKIARLAFPPREEQEWSGDPAPVSPEAVQRMAQAFRDPHSLAMRSTTNPRAAYNDPEVLTGGWPATGLVTTARALASHYRDLLAGELLPPPMLTDAIRERVRGIDEVLQSISAYGLGYGLPSESMIVPPAARPTSFGHAGAGGSIGLADPAHDLAFAFIPNLRRDWLAGDRRAYQLLEAVYAAL
ncbi:class A beta-lactamase-related serine hydrolase [Nocardia yunnanensis]|uniref:Class A beta-lactamase-related serine hydrolase n=1 Tax=Nocardia yunnanensis TaxID=2382165 RepID=A0A386Z9Y3_9NOCA|nr:serine hydrolase domain-containing protein [Nocardia yunnanensis]AYF73983.1 class A beta-lactamase-related serine hydrolase [Nocardia yunnanensis]